MGCDLDSQRLKCCRRRLKLLKFGVGPKDILPLGSPGYISS